MDEARRQVLQAELDEAIEQRNNLNTYIQVLGVRLGVSVDDDAPGDAKNGQAGAVLPPGQDPVALIFEGELVGMSLPKAVAEVLRRYSPDPHKRPIKTPVLVAALQKGGLDVQTPRQLYRSLYNSSALQQIKGGQWGFATWYPDIPKGKAKSAGNSASSDDGAADETTVPDQGDGAANEGGVS